MSKIIPPMISSSPPPMDDTLEEEDDDEFGSFSTANFSYNLDVTQPSKLSTNVEWEGSVKRQYDFNTVHLVERTKKNTTCNDVAHHNGTHSNIEVLPDTFLTEEDEEVAEAFPRDLKGVSSIPDVQLDSTSQDSVVSVATDSGLCSASQDSEGTSPLPTVKGFTVYLPASDNVSHDDSSSSEETLGKSSNTDLAGQFISSLENANDTSVHIRDSTLSKNVHVLSDLNLVERRLQDSKQLGEDDSKVLFSTSVNQELKDVSGVDNFCDFSDFQAERSNLITNGSNVSVLSLVDGVKTSADKSLLDNVPNNLSKREGELLANNALNIGGLGCDSNMPSECSRHLSVDTNINKEFDSNNMVECDFNCKTTGSLASNSENHITGDPLDSDDDFADLASSAVPSLPIASSSPGVEQSASRSSDKEFANFTLCNVQSLTSPSSASANKLGDALGSDDEFAAFASCEVRSSSVNSSALIIKPIASLSSSEEFADFKFGEMIPLSVASSAAENKPSETSGSDDEFADFSSSVLPSVDAKEDGGWVDESAMKLPAVTRDINQIDDDFDDFETASFSLTAIPTVTDNSQLTSRLENVVTTLFPGPGSIHVEASETTVLPRSRMVESNPVWGDLRDVDTSHALSYQWGNSSAHKMLLSALGIDTRNILFGAKWNVAVPRFAANLGISPLEPVRAHSPSVLQPTRELHPKSSVPDRPEVSISSGSEATVPDAQFDWTSSGLVNPLDCEEKDGRRTSTGGNRTVDYGQQLLTSTGIGGRRGLSAEAVKVLENLPNLSFLRTQVLMFPLPGQALTH